MRRHRPRVLVDVDDVLADCHTPMIKLANDIAGTNFEPSDFTDWDLFKDPRIIPYADEIWRCIYGKGWFLSLSPLDHSVRAVWRLAMFSEILILTSSLDAPHYHHERNAWLKMHLGVDRRHIVYTHSKYLVDGDVFIDDKPDNIFSWIAEHPEGLGILFTTPMNGHDKRVHHRVIRTRDWVMIEELIRKRLGA